MSALELLQQAFIDFGDALSGLLNAFIALFTGGL